MKNLSDVLPIYATEKDMILSKMGDISIAYQLTLPEIFTLSNQDFELLHQTWLKAIKVLPTGCVLHKQDWFVEEEVTGDFEKEHSFLSRSSERFFHERPFLSHNCYLILTFPPKDRKAVNSLFSSLLRRHIVPVETIDPGYANLHENTCSQFVRILTDSGLISCNRLGNKDLVDLINRYLILDTDKVRRDMDFSDGIRVGEKHCSVFSISSATDLPAFCGPRINYEKYSTDSTKFPIGFVTPICQLLGVNHIYHQFIRIEEPALAIKQLEKKKLRLQSLSAYSRDNFIARDATDSFLQEAVAEQRLPVRAHFHLITWVTDSTKISELKNACISALSSLDISPRLETIGAPQLYWAGIPGNGADLPVNETFFTFSNQASCLINTETGYRSNSTSFGIRLGDRETGRPQLVDISDEPMKRGIISNRNKFVISPSGGGKSFTMNHIVRSYFEFGTHTLLVDIGHSYQGLCKLLNGYYFTYSETNPIRFNPFHLQGETVPDIEKKESIKTLLLALWKKDDEPFSRSEFVALSNAVQMYYEKEMDFRCFNSFYDFLVMDFSAAIKREAVSERDFSLSNFLFVLKPFYKGGEYDYLLNATENLDMLEARFIVFELDNIKSNATILPVITIIIMDVFLSKMRKLKGIRKMIVIEEAWKALMREGMAEYIKYLFKTVRKHFGEAVVVTQDIEDIISSPIVKQAIINNSDCKILLDQSKYENRFEQVQELLGLTEKEKALVLSLNKANDPTKRYKEIFISLGGRLSKVYRLETSPEEYLAYTTEESEKLLVTQAAEKYGSMEAGIKSIAHE